MSAFTVAGDKSFMRVNQKIETDVFMKCVIGSEYGTSVDCFESCLISIGKEIKED